MSNTNNNMQTQTSSALHNAIIEAGGEDHPPILWSKMSITGVLGRGWGSPADWSEIDPRNNGKDRPDQAKDASGSGSTKELRRSETKADGVRGWGQSYAQAEPEICRTFQGVSKSWESCLQAGTSS
ncbi:hypothetical protein Tco_1139013, partial [Tanacetum coccineum]